ncbi:MAG: alpha/beta hydrolase [Chloroflexota bacterium]
MAPSLSAYLQFLSLYLRIRRFNRRAELPPLPGGVLDEQTALMRQALQVLGETPLDQLTPAQARLDMRNNIKILKITGGLWERVESVRELRIPGPQGEIPARLYLPGEETCLPMFVYFHGGGWAIGDLDTGDNVARFICKRAHCTVLSVDYRLGPEHPFPAAVDDSYAATCWAVEHAAELNGDPRRVLVGGDSAGGNLAAVLAILSRRDGGPALSGQVLIYPSVDSATLDTPSYRDFGGGDYGLPTADVEWFLDQYVPILEDRRNPLVSPLLADDLGGLPPALVVTAEYDVLRDEGEAYAGRMMEAGVAVKLIRCNGMVHGFISMFGLLQRATQYFDEVIVEIRRMFAA